MGGNICHHGTNKLQTLLKGFGKLRSEKLKVVWYIWTNGYLERGCNTIFHAIGTVISKSNCK